MAFVFVNSCGIYNLKHHEKKIIFGDDVTEVILPRITFSQTKMSFINLSGHSLILRSHQSNKIFSQLFAPCGTNEIVIEDKRKVKLTFIQNSKCAKNGIWFIEIC